MRARQGQAGITSAVCSCPSDVAITIGVVPAHVAPSQIAGVVRCGQVSERMPRGRQALVTMQRETMRRERLRAEQASAHDDASDPPG